ncbi:SDR family oxidoreductase [soil metagenome]
MSRSGRTIDGHPTNPLVVVVTGASRGVGLELTRHLHDDGHRVIAACRRPDDSHDLASIGVPIVPLDLDDDATIDVFAERVARNEPIVDIVVNNAGVKRAPGHSWSESAGPLPELSRSSLRSVIDTNLIGALLVTQAIAPIVRRPGGTIVNVSSQLGSLELSTGLDYGYNCSKAGLNMATVQMSRDPALAGVTVVAMNPGWIRTEMSGDDAPLDIIEATREIADLLPRIVDEMNGCFVDRFGSNIDW